MEDVDMTIQISEIDPKLGSYPDSITGMGSQIAPGILDMKIPGLTLKCLYISMNELFGKWRMLQQKQILLKI